ncbi:hemolysin III family protein [Brevundimonas goettingensis]|uniref:Hemolysin III family protein n=2 Tax=Brevundimonas goettingensis TaxID=2774190 RepID=A0A975C051_9CAUL|nr:hemolysin III family protein [Brevundimonas goettingensis]QTC91231.1 hemolysin III family protein [Brevundimonas goettingensis]
MKMRLRSLFTHVCTPDALDMIDHYQTRAERLADLWVHVTGLSLAGVGGVVLAGLAAIYGGPGTVIATAVYAVCLIAMLSVSTIYNWTNPCAARPVLRRMDEAAIFLMIAGSYTPFTTQRFEGMWSIGFTLAVWLIAGAGVATKLVAPRISDAFWSGVYVLFGWLAVLALKPMLETVHPVALSLLVLGGLIYTAGVFVFISPRLKYRRAIWHGFVVAGAGVHWVAVLLGVVLVPQMA